MEISLTEQQTTDFDWFGVDEEGLIGHFTTAGFKQLPRSVSKSAEDLATVKDYFDQSAAGGGYLLHPEFEKHVTDLKDEHARKRYLRSFISMSEKGLFSFDIKTYVVPDLVYFLVTMPQTPLRIKDLPVNIGEIVSRTLLRGIYFREHSTIPYELALQL